MLIFYDDPFYPVRDFIPNHLYYFIHAVLSSTFIAFQLFVWLVIVHSVATEDNIITIDETKFYWPKAFVTVVLWIALITE
jgi:hypothetical protein